MNPGGAAHRLREAWGRGPRLPDGLLPRLGLRSTVTLFFALGALIVSALLSIGTYLVARHYLIDQRQQTALRQTYADASFVADGLRTQGAKVPDVLGSVNAPSDSELIVRLGGRWFSSSLNQGPQTLPGSVRKGVAAGDVTYVWSRVQGQPAIVIGVPLKTVDAEFYEVAVTTELAATLTTLAIVLGAFALLSTAAGAVLGRFASRRLMAPLDSVATAAARIGAGGLQTRLPPTDDPDLATIVGSFNSMVEALEERIQRDARFAADLGHELRSPLTTLVASVQIIERRRDELPERTRRAVDLVSVELARFHQTLEDLLELGRLDAGVREQVLVHLEADELVRETLVTSHRDPGLLAVEGANLGIEVDKRQLSRSLVNLLDNADRHAGGATAVLVRRVRDRIRILVDDDGPGVPASERERIFERFVRGGSRGSLPGSGLGLSIVGETVSSHGGRVWCEEAPGGGARFCIELPAAALRPRSGVSVDDRSPRAVDGSPSGSGGLGPAGATRRGGTREPSW
ncbi:MAG: ATP-binding protein [Lapillicoccus sp.]